jgi:hypothetical protein
VKNILFLVSELRIQMQLGISLTHSLEKFLLNRQENDFKLIRLWFLKLQTGSNAQDLSKKYPQIHKTTEQRALLKILEKGMAGSPVDSYLQDFEQELVHSLENQFERQLQILPLKLMIPLTFLILPAIMLLLLAPLIITLGRWK